jgi:hypothetical protein
MREYLKSFELEAAERFNRFLDREGGEASNADGQSFALHSIALSLKRLADTNDRALIEFGDKLAAIEMSVRK